MNAMHRPAEATRTQPEDIEALDEMDLAGNDELGPPPQDEVYADDWRVRE